jgi:hypothetical protein
MPLRSLSRLSALPVLLAAGVLSCRATPIVAAADALTAQAKAVNDGVPIGMGSQPMEARDAVAGVAGMAEDEAAPVPEATPENTAPAVEEEPTGDPFPSLWVYALGGCGAVALAAFRAR